MGLWLKREPGDYESQLEKQPGLNSQSVKAINELMFSLMLKKN